jgi:FtsP/CotA-like multicopper oxidase with cupredoxin domain
MKRRHFLQLAAGTVAGAVVVHSSPRAAARAFPGEPLETLAMLLEKNSDGNHQWTLHGHSHLANEPLFLPAGRHYRLRLMNGTGSAHTLRLPNHSFAITRIHQAPVSGMVRNSIRLERYNVVEADVFLQQQQPLVID